MLRYFLRDNKFLGTKYQPPGCKNILNRDTNSQSIQVLQVSLSIQWRFSESGGKKNTHNKINKRTNKRIVHIYLESSDINKRTAVLVCLVKGGHGRSVTHASNKCSTSVDSTVQWQHHSSSWECWIQAESCRQNHPRNALFEMWLTKPLGSSSSSAILLEFQKQL